jgi:hypothetical protein
MSNCFDIEPDKKVLCMDCGSDEIYIGDDFQGICYECFGAMVGFTKITNQQYVETLSNEEIQTASPQLEILGDK